MFQINFESKVDASRGDFMVVGVFAGDGKKKAPLRQRIPKAIDSLCDAEELNLILKKVALQGFDGQDGQTVQSDGPRENTLRRIQWIGLGAKPTLQTFRELGAKALKARTEEELNLILVVPETSEAGLNDCLTQSALGVALADYRFDKYTQKKYKGLASLDIVGAKKPSNSARERILGYVDAIRSGTFLARDLVNEPAGSLNPVRFAEVAKDLAKGNPLKVKVLDEKALAKENMNMMLAVSKASLPYTPPRLVKIEYAPKNAKKHICLVGKGLTFDSGGLDLKPPASMLDMKLDMGGAAAVIGAMAAIAKLEPKCRVTGYLGCVENGIGGNAYHPGDVLISRKGISVEVNNTDAEGRLVLGDCIDYAITKDKPDVLVDLATLTGACMIALGPLSAGLYSDDETLLNKMLGAGSESIEGLWRLPLDRRLLPQLKSLIADTKNTGKRYGGSITAALFLEKFVDGRVKWAHLDVAGPAMSEGDLAWVPKGGAGFGVETLARFVSTFR